MVDQRYIGLSRDEKKERVISEGVRYENLVCPLCGLNRVRRKHAKGEVRFDHVDIHNAYFLQVRYTAGGRSGFYLNEDESLTFRDAVKDPELREKMAEIKRQCERIVRYLDVLGV